MRKIGVVTFQRAENYGAVLQAYALSRTLNKLGATASVIDYRAPAIENEYRVIALKGRKVEAVIKSFILSVLSSYISIRRKRAFDRFCQKYLPLSESVDSTGLADLTKDYDALITGSDQVFNPDVTKDDCINYYLSFANKSTSRYSYAASFGRNQLSQAEKSLVRPELLKFEQISVRESSGSEIVYELTERRAEVHMDPVFLLHKDEWNSICSSLATKKPYILLYVVVPNEAVYKYASELSNRTHLKVICISAPIKAHFRHYQFHYINAVSPNTFLSLLRDAEYVVSSSFHGTAFSILFEKQFVVITPKEYNRNDRINSLLRQFGLESRTGERPDINSPIEWKDVEERIGIEIGKSMDYLKGIVENSNE